MLYVRESLVASVKFEIITVRTKKSPKWFSFWKLSGDFGVVYLKTPRVLWDSVRSSGLKKNNIC